ncbi:hypothetical protein L1987_20712 [Smallanthus sonchifolius]|uniref:Uncharacterized protein n=1 Tax=Smallanthus sonchifolius TaxID=185202 RepID=A0ACB9IRZ0_9ASTR|nr:hypothetical protein L1987_20712 [Smallanthus sonchifolius]
MRGKEFRLFLVDVYFIGKLRCMSNLLFVVFFADVHDVEFIDPIIPDAPRDGQVEDTETDSDDTESDDPDPDVERIRISIKKSVETASIPSKRLKMVANVIMRKVFREDDVTGEEVMEEEGTRKDILRIYYALCSINFSSVDLLILHNNKILYHEEWRIQGLQYQGVVDICVKNKVCAGNR